MEIVCVIGFLCNCQVSVHTCAIGIICGVWERGRDQVSEPTSLELTMSVLCIITLASIVAERGISLHMHEISCGNPKKHRRVFLSLSLFATQRSAVIGKVYVSTLWKSKNCTWRWRLQSDFVVRTAVLLFLLHISFSFIAYDDCKKKK